MKPINSIEDKGKDNLHCDNAAADVEASAGATAGPVVPSTSSVDPNMNNFCEKTTAFSCDEGAETENDKGPTDTTAAVNLRGTTTAHDSGLEDAYPEETESCEEKEEEGPDPKPIGRQEQQCIQDTLSDTKAAETCADRDVTGQEGNIKASTVEFSDNHAKSMAKSKPTKISELGKISLNHRGSSFQSQVSSTAGPGAYPVRTATIGDPPSRNNTEEETLQGQQQQQPDGEEDRPPCFWRDESTASAAGACTKELEAVPPKRNSVLVEATLVDEEAQAISHLYPPVTVNSYGRPRRLSSAQRQHHHSFSRHHHPREDVECVDGGNSVADIAEATALSSNGVVWFCLQSRKGIFLVMGSFLLVAGVILGLVLGLPALGAGEDGNSINPPVNSTYTPTLEPSVSPSLAPTQAPTRLFGATVLPEILQESLLDPTSAQSMAMEWMINDPHLNRLPLERKLQRYAMVSLYYTTMGESSWSDSTSWLDYEVSECEWYSGVQGGRKPCNAALELIHLVLPSNELKGSLPEELMLLSRIQSLDLSGNPTLTGSMPPALWQGELANNLKSLDLSHTSLTGSLQANLLGSWTQLTSLNLESVSYLTGGLPSQLGLLSSSLEDLSLSMSRLSGTFPSQVGQLSRLTSLKMRGCHLSGVYPTELGQLSSLEYLDLGENTVSGTIPSEIGLLSSLDLIAMDNNFLSGLIPSEVGWMKRMSTFNVFQNRLSGSIPTELMQVSGLKYLLLNQNRLRSSIPTEIGNLSNLLWLLVWDNQLTGTVPTELQSNTALTLMSLATNPLSGTIPTEVFTVSSLEWLFLGWSFLSGTIPTEVGKLTNMVGLYLNSAKLTGTVPTELGLLHHMTDLWIDSHNNNNNGQLGLSGEIPSEVGNIKFLTKFQVNNNSFNGTLPSEIGKLASLETMKLSHNKLTGSLPTSIGGLRQVSVVDLQDNFLTGPVPVEELTSLPFLRELHLHNNSFSGELPIELCDLDILAFDCSELLCGCQCSCQSSG